MADDQLKLIALDEKDLEIVSSHLQDAVVRVGDLAYVPSQKRFGALRAATQESSADVNKAVAAIIDRVRRDKDEGLIDLTLRYDRVDIRKIGMRVAQSEIAEARAGADSKTLSALELARDRIL